MTVRKENELHKAKHCAGLLVTTGFYVLYLVSVPVKTLTHLSVSPQSPLVAVLKLSVTWSSSRLPRNIKLNEVKFFWEL